MNPRMWLYFVFDKNACIAYQTAEACGWSPTSIYIREGDDTLDVDGYLLGRAGDGNVLRGLFNPNSGAIDAWAQPTVRRYTLEREARTRWAQYLGQAGISAPLSPPARAAGEQWWL